MPRPRPPCPRVLIALVLAALVAPFATASDRPNVLLVSIDSLRRDALGCYGARLPYAPGVSPSPNLDRLAANGVRMTDAYAPSPWTLPSHLSLLTGQSPLVHGVETDLQRLSGDVTTLAEALRAAGYRTAGLFSGPYLEPQWGLGRGFERYRAAYGDQVAAASAALAGLDAEMAAAEQRGDRATADELRWKRRGEYERVRALSHGDVSSERVTAGALDELATMGKAGAPWFLFVHYFDVHYDYVPPPPWPERFDPTYRGSMTGHGFFKNPAVAVPDPNVVEGYVRHVSDRDLEHLRALYAGEVAWVDEHVGRLLRRLDDLRVADRTLVVVVSDHGDEFFEHGGIGHRRNVAEEVIHVPMILRLPRVLPAGREVKGLVSLADVPSTVYELLRLPVPPGVSGLSFAGVMRGTEDGAKRPLFSRLVRVYDGQLNFDGTAIPSRMAFVQEAFRYRTIKIVRRRRWPLIPSDLPDGQRAVLQDYANRQFRREERSWIDLARFPFDAPEGYRTDFRDREAHRALGAYRMRYKQLRAMRAAVAHDDAAPDAALRSKLEGLGYLDDSPAPSSPRSGFILPTPVERLSDAPR
jgi:arylsulfatase A-like enzyme